MTVTITKKQKGALLIGLIGFSLLPIWRCVGGQSGMTFWEYANIAFLRPPDSYPHIPTEKAIVNARRAYCEVKGLNYGEIYDSYPISLGIGAGVPSGVG